MGDGELLEAQIHGEAGESSPLASVGLSQEMVQQNDSSLLD